jgi:hypothetical protein
MVNISVKRGVQQLGEMAIVSMMDELSQLHERKSFLPIKYDKLTVSQRNQCIRSILFLKQKGDGRIKSRLVTDGSMQIRSSESDLTSPTVSTEGLFLTLAIDAN